MQCAGRIRVQRGAIIYDQMSAEMMPFHFLHPLLSTPQHAKPNYRR